MFKYPLLLTLCHFLLQFKQLHLQRQISSTLLHTIAEELGVFLVDPFRAYGTYMIIFYRCFSSICRRVNLNYRNRILSNIFLLQLKFLLGINTKYSTCILLILKKLIKLLISFDLIAFLRFVEYVGDISISKERATISRLKQISKALIATRPFLYININTYGFLQLQPPNIFAKFIQTPDKIFIKTPITQL